MLTLLIPVDGSDYSRRAVDYAIRRAAATQGPTRVHLLNVQAPIVTVNVKLFVSQESLETYYREEGTKALADTLALAQKAGLETHPHIGVGDAARVVLDYAAEKAVDEIVMGSHGRRPRRLGRAESGARSERAGGARQVAFIYYAAVTLQIP
jgi:nucleotide-binding universal stress UspA family protein